MEEYTSAIKTVIADYTYLAVFLALMLENTVLLGIFIPGLTVLILAGFACGSGELDLLNCILAGFLGTFIGDNISYALGRYGTARLGFVKRIVERNHGIRARVRGLGFWALIFFHFPGYLRMILPVILGVSKFNFQKWLVIDLIGSALFNTAFVIVGYLVARTTGLFAEAASFGGWLQFLFALFFIIWSLSIFHGYMNLGKYVGRR